MPQINIMMVGGRRCGKSTILAALRDQANTAFNGKMVLDPDEENIMSGVVLDNVLYTAQNYFINYDPYAFFKPDDHTNGERKDYNFALKITGKRDSGINFRFTDVPGEWFKPSSGHMNEIKEIISESQVLIIGIDTPYLMEEKGAAGYGIRHNTQNYVMEITQYIRDQLNVNSALKGKLILFVPVKCEKYYYEDRMEELAQTVKTGYKELLDYLKSPNLRNDCSVAILPIISLGGLEFFSFEDGYMYRQNAEYSPKFCEQPLIYSVLYGLKTAIDSNYKGGKWTAFLHLFNKGVVTKEDFAALFDFISTLAVKDKSKGYEILQDPIKMIKKG